MLTRSVGLNFYRRSMSSILTLHDTWVEVQRIAKNTAALFARQIVLALISLYTVRLVVQSLGIADYGLLIAALSVAMLPSFVNASVEMTTLRYLSFAIGEHSGSNLRRYYGSCFLMTIGSAAFILLLLETVGLWFVSRQMVIEPDRYDAVTTLYHLLVIQIALGTIASFHSSVILAHEDMNVFALFSILGGLLRLGAAFSIAFFGTDTLVSYGYLLLASVIVVTIAQWAYCARQYEECASGRVSADVVTLREMFGFMRWTLFGQFTTVCRTQALTLLINQAFNPATVAARALSFTIYAQVQTFSQNFTSALNPPIIKSYASGNLSQTLSLIVLGSKLAFFLSFIVTLPLITLLPGVLNLWLGTYPDETVLFSRLALVEGLILSISFPLMTAARAVGDMRAYELMLGGLQILILVCSWLLVRGGFPAYSVFLVAIGFNVVMFFVRIWLVRRTVDLDVPLYVKSVILPIFITVLSSVALTVALVMLAPESTALELTVDSIAAAAAILLFAPVCSYAFGLTDGERRALRAIVASRFVRTRK